MNATAIARIHPDDLLFFDEVRLAMVKVAKAYDLPLRTVEPFPMPEDQLVDRLGDCSSTGDIRLVMRATVGGDWCEAPRSPDLVWRTAAHELPCARARGRRFVTRANSGDSYS